MRAKPLLSQQPVTADGQLPSQELVIILQVMAAMLNAQQAQIADALARIEALEGP